jgi:hypothetical protein
LADRLGFDREGFVRTIHEYNAAVQPGHYDPTVLDGKHTEGITPTKSNWALPIDTPPYLGYAVTCGITFTFGGLKIDTRGQVIDTEGNVMPGLYAAGELVGGLFYHNYAGDLGLPPERCLASSLAVVPQKMPSESLTACHRSDHAVTDHCDREASDRSRNSKIRL